MHLIDWTFLEGFFGEYGKLLVAGIALVVGVISLVVAVLKYLKAKILEEERNHARDERNEAKAALDVEKAIVQEQRKTLALNEAEFGRKNDALQQAAEELRQQRSKIELREQKLEQIRTAFIGKEHDLW